jgi:hypothetical protein
MSHQISIGDVVYVIPGSGGANALRAGAGTDKRALGWIPEGRPLEILSGPEEVEDPEGTGNCLRVKWWRVEARCKDGKVRQGYTSERGMVPSAPGGSAKTCKTFLQPYRDCPDGGKSLLESRLAHEEQASVKPTDGVNVRELPDVTSHKIAGRAKGAKVTVYGHPRCDAKGRVWWSLIWPESEPGQWVCEVDVNEVRLLDPA